MQTNETKKYFLGIPYSSIKEENGKKIIRTFFKTIKKLKTKSKTTYYFLGIKLFTKKKPKIKCLQEDINSVKSLIYDIKKDYSQYQLLVNETEELKISTQNLLNNQQELHNKLKHLPIYISAKEVHSKVFPKYKNCNSGKELVLLGAGPTLDYYTVLENKLHLGVNRTPVTGKANLDYLFVQDYLGDIQNTFDNYQGNNCKKFYGVHYLVPGISQSHADKANAERYYFIDCDYDSVWDFPPDISILPFKTYSSVIHSAFTFALWTGVSKIYLVGCDTNNNGYSKTIQYEGKTNILCADNVKQGWIKMKKFAQEFYPDTEIISINPVGLRGIFKDVYTQNYLNDHPEIENAKTLAAVSNSGGGVVAKFPSTKRFEPLAA